MVKVIHFVHHSDGGIDNRERTKGTRSLAQTQS